jgi:hypothetical protein
MGLVLDEPGGPITSACGMEGTSRLSRIIVPDYSSGKEGAKDVPSWARGNRPMAGEDGKTFAGRLLDQQYGAGNWEKGAGSEFSQIQKWADRSFMDPPSQ